MAIFNLEIKCWSDVDLEERIAVDIDIESWRSLRRIIKDFLEARKFL